MIEEALYNLLMDDAGISAIVDERIYPVYLPQDTDFPAITFQQVGFNEDHTCSGPVGLVDARFQITCWAEDHTDLINLVQKVKNKLNCYVDSTSGIQGTMIESMGDISYTGDAEEQNRYGKYIDVTISYNDK